MFGKWVADLEMSRLPGQAFQRSTLVTVADEDETELQFPPICQLCSLNNVLETLFHPHTPGVQNDCLVFWPPESPTHDSGIVSVVGPDVCPVRHRLDPVRVYTEVADQVGAESVVGYHNRIGLA
ncbi:hypothetical protein BHQ18_12295 [Mycolicibacterium flavescens]|uniref:Uncharacterized protein n=1 Tax=Mycolicibacterium flavescens TaxID=1776 RepID=A0A1E3RK22_MYCFV|nr:hypothetical protein BHQ18_12295 [Mycolicibacterium flavescens]